MQAGQEKTFFTGEYRLRVCYTEAALTVASREEGTRVRTAALLTTVQGQHRRNEGRCVIGPKVMDGEGRLKNARTRVWTAALLTTVQGQNHANEGRYNIGSTAIDGEGRLKNVRVPGMPLFSTPSKVNTAERRGAATLSRRRGAKEEDARTEAIYDRDAR